MRWSVRTLSPLAAGLVVLGLAVAPAQADPSAVPPTLTSPAADSHVGSGSTGPITLDFSASPAGSYTVTVDCTTAGRVLSTTVEHDGTTAPAGLATSPVTGPDTCTVGGTTPDTSAWTAGSYTVDAAPEPPEPAVTLTDVALDASSFYPTVVDGYRDTVALTWTSNVVAAHSLRVLDGRGRVVRSAYYPSVAAGGHRWAWNGRDTSGRTVAPGSYRVQVRANDGRGSNPSAIAPVTVATRYVYHRGSAARWGDTGGLSTSGSCYATRDSDAGTADLDCWGGRYAQVAFGFRLPATTYAVRYSVSGAFTEADICCDGKLVRSGTRSSPTAYRVAVRVNGWRAYAVQRVAVSYSWKVRI